jgi:hypothetical protein
MKKTLFIISFLLSICFANAQTYWTNKTKLKGTIGKYEIEMTLAIPVGGATPCFTIGEYYYTSKKKKINLCSQDDIKIVEEVNGKETGYFIIKDWDKNLGQTVIGSWHTMDNKKNYFVKLIVVEKGKY